MGHINVRTLPEDDAERQPRQRSPTCNRAGVQWRRERSTVAVLCIHSNDVSEVWVVDIGVQAHAAEQETPVPCQQSDAHTGEVERTVWPVAVEALEIRGAHTRDLTTALHEILLGAHGMTLSPTVSQARRCRRVLSLSLGAERRFM